jgi:small-conductance mechanosensitive channel
MKTRTKHAANTIDLLFTVAFFAFAAVDAYLAYKLFLAKHLVPSLAIIAVMLVAMLFGAMYLREILVRRWAEREIAKGREEK